MVEERGPAAYVAEFIGTFALVLFITVAVSLYVTPTAPGAPEPFIDFNSGYVVRAIEQFPKQGSRAPWRLYQNYPRDILALRRGDIEDGALEFSLAAVPLPLTATLRC